MRFNQEKLCLKFSTLSAKVNKKSIHIALFNPNKILNNQWMLQVRRRQLLQICLIILLWFS